MIFKQLVRSSFVLLLLALSIFVRSTPAMALDGASPLRLFPLNGWDAFELVTQGNDISAISDSGYGTTASRGVYDGLGAYLDGSTLSIFVNHEVSNNAAISRVDLNLADFQQSIASTIDNGVTAFPSSIVTGMGYAYDTIYDGTYNAMSNPNPVAIGTVAVGNYSNSHFSRFCSGSSYLANSFGTNRGFVDEMYITGEEVFNTSGLFYALDSATETLWEVPDLGGGSWENAAQVDTGNTTHTAMYLSEDNLGSRLQLYVGEKGVDVNSDGEIDFLERNGLRGGTVYYFIPNAGFSTFDLPNGTVEGTWSTSTIGALREDKLEDVHTNPADGTQLILGDQTDGVYKIDLDLQFSGNMLDTASSTATIDQIVPELGGGSLGNPDNVTWSSEPNGGKLYVQQDGAGNGMWQMDPDGTNRVQIAGAFSEPSGIFDVSGYAGYEPGSVFLSSLQGNGFSGAQLAVLISPTAAVLPEEALVDIKPGGDVNPINLKSKGVLSVALLSTEDLDVNDVDIDSLLFGDPLLIDNGGTAVSPLRSAYRDVSGDGLLDLTLKFRTADLVEDGVLGPDTIEGLLTGALLDGTLFEGMDSIRIVPPNGSNANNLQTSAVPEPTTCTLALAALCLAMR